MFTAALFTTARTWKQPRRTRTEEWIKRLWYIHTMEYSVQFSSVTQSCLTLCDPMNCSTPGLPVHHHLPEFTQTHIHWVTDAIEPSHPLSSPSPATAKSLQLCPTLCDSIDGSPPGSPVPGILQARILEWAAISSCPQSLPASESFPMSQPVTWGGQNTGVSALASFLTKNTKGWSPLEWISLQSKEIHCF